MQLSFDASLSTELYLNLLKRSLTNTIFSTEPNPNQDDHSRYVAAAIGHYQQSYAVSMLPLVRLDNLQFCITDALDKDVAGDLVETGVWRGGAAIFMRAMLKILNVRDRVVWAATCTKDSLSLMPKNFRWKRKLSRARQ